MLEEDHGDGAQDRSSSVMAGYRAVGDCHSSDDMALYEEMIARVRSWLNPILGAVLVVLIFGYAVVHKYLTWSWFAANKDALSSVNSVIGSAAILLGGVLAYYRFFRGRTFSTRAELAMSVNVLHAPAEKFLHVLTLSVKNLGTVSIWNPQPIVKVSAHRRDGNVSSEPVHRWDEGALTVENSPRLSVLDSGESGDFFMQRFFPKDIWAVTYSATVRCSTGETWTKLVTVENLVPDKKSEVP